ncbi:hypothetical protein [Burkholderia cenocepacia]|uniref:hypothetical protein n=1 Tax=Burkholderia cenocepacia TaxID=95486 RepID=UPI0008476245|nr:hypothetical protein [Burkholderia cenocepacia]
MANQQYPTDGGTPVQTLTFHYEGGASIYFYLYPQPDAKRERVATVEITYEMPGWPSVVELDKGRLHSLIEAGVLAYNQAQTEGQVNKKGKIVEAWIDGREFLTSEDLTDIVGNAFPVLTK